MKIAGSQVRIRTFEAAAIALGGDADVVADTALDAAEDTEVLATAFDGQPDVARNVTVKGNDANVTGDVVVEGFDLTAARSPRRSPSTAQRWSRAIAPSLRSPQSPCRPTTPPTPSGSGLAWARRSACRYV